jgi:tRNA threonylcarbamoyladenosine biosynthesis protein TsaB
MALLLSLESSTTMCSASLHERGKLIIDREIHEPQVAASRLVPLVDELFHATGIQKKNLKGVAISGGPGSYTGLRISASTAKGICYALDVPLISLNTLHILAASLHSENNTGLLCPMIDARRMEVYTCLLTRDGEELEPVQPMVIDEQSFSKYLQQGRVVFFGNGATKCKEVIRHPNAIFVDGLYPRAAAMGTAAFRKFESGELADARTFEPSYLKEFSVKTKKT